MAVNDFEQLRQQAEDLARSKAWPEALEKFLQVYNQHPEDCWCLRRLGEIYYRLGEGQKGKEHLKSLATIYRRQGAWAKAISVAKLILKIDPQDSEIKDGLVELYSLVETEALASRSEPIIDLDPPAQRESPATVNADNSSVHEGSLGTPPINEELASLVGFEGLFDKALRKQEADLEKVSIPLFSDFSVAEFGEIVQKFSRILVPAGRLICDEGDLGDSIYVIVTGELVVSIEQEDGSRLELANLKSGEVFGEFGLLNDGKRNARVVAKTPAEMLEITKRDFSDISKEHPRVVEVLDRYCKDRIVDRLLAQTMLFQRLTRQQRAPFLASLTLRKAPADKPIVSEGDTSSDLYLIKSGRFDVSIKRGESQIIIAQLGAGDFFGELALLSGKPRTATVTPRSQAQLLMIEEEKARTILQSDPAIRLVFEQTVAKAAEGAEQAHLYYKMLKSNLSMV